MLAYFPALKRYIIKKQALHYFFDCYTSARKLARYEEWRFIHYTHDELCLLLTDVESASRTTQADLALEKGYGLLEIGVGSHAPQQFVLTTPANLDILLREFCQNYIKAHGMRIVETEGDNHDLVV